MPAEQLPDGMTRVGGLEAANMMFAMINDLIWAAARVAEVVQASPVKTRTNIVFDQYIALAKEFLERSTAIHAEYQAGVCAEDTVKTGPKI